MLRHTVQEGHSIVLHGYSHMRKARVLELRSWKPGNTWCMMNKMTEDHLFGMEGREGNMVRAQAWTMARAQLVDTVFPLAASMEGHTEHFLREQWAMLQALLGMASKIHNGTKWVKQEYDTSSHTVLEYATEIEGDALLHGVKFTVKVSHNRKFGDIRGTYGLQHLL